MAWHGMPAVQRCGPQLHPPLLAMHFWGPMRVQMKPKAEAREEFQAAVQQGHTAVLAQQEPSTQMFTLELGNLEAMTEAVVEISYVTLLQVRPASQHQGGLSQRHHGSARHCAKALV